MFSKLWLTVRSRLFSHSYVSYDISLFRDRDDMDPVALPPPQREPFEKQGLHCHGEPIGQEDRAGTSLMTRDGSLRILQTFQHHSPAHLPI